MPWSNCVPQLPSLCLRARGTTATEDGRPWGLCPTTGEAIATAREQPPCTATRERWHPADPAQPRYIIQFKKKTQQK